MLLCGATRVYSLSMQSTILLLTAAVICVSSVGGCSSYLGSGADATAAAAESVDSGSVATLAIADPAASLDGYSRFLPDEKRNNPSAGAPSYVYLHAGT